MPIRAIFTPDYTRYEGVRPINIYLLRLLYLLMVIFVAPYAWRVILTHQGPWDHVRAVAFCVWATYTTMSILGLIHPLRFLPIMLFMIAYKTLWLLAVAYPLWRAGTLVGSPAEAMARQWIWIPFMSVIIPWKYVFQNYVMWTRKKSVRLA